MNKDLGKLPTVPGMTIDSVVNDLLAVKARGDYAYFIFDGFKWDSETITMDFAYMQILHETKEEFDAHQAEFNSEQAKEERKAKELKRSKEAMKQTYNLMASGIGLVNKEQELEWCETVASNLQPKFECDDVSSGYLLTKAALYIMQGISEGEDILKVMDNANVAYCIRGASGNIIESIVSHFYKDDSFNKFLDKRTANADAWLSSLIEYSCTPDEYTEAYHNYFQTPPCKVKRK